MNVETKNRYLTLALLALGLGGALIMVSQSGEARWYTQEQVERGAPLFAANCAACHGTEAQGLAEDWRKTGPDGKHPPPPLNGTAHAWHHPLKILRRTIREGGAKFGGVMPPFEDRLKAQEIDDIIAWFQSHWSDEIYAIWRERDQAAGRSSSGSGVFVPLTAEAKAASSDEQVEAVQDALRDAMGKKPEAAPKPAKPDYSATLRALERRIPGMKFEEPVETPVEGVLEVGLRGERIYVTKDGKHAFFGDLVDLTSGDNLTENKRRANRLALIDAFPETQRVIYPAAGQEKARLAVFTDTSCPFCRKLHEEINVLLTNGVSVHYIPFPRGGKRGAGYKTLRAVWCANDPLEAMTTAKENMDGKDLPTPGNCSRADAVDLGYELGQSIRIRGTPAIVLPSGELINGYQPTPNLLARIAGGR